MQNSFAGTFEVLQEPECWHLLRTQTVGRVAWIGPQGIEVLPVNYIVADDAVVFRTTSTSALTQLTDGTGASFQIDDIDGDTQTGWSVLARGRATAAGDDLSAAADDIEPWALGQRTHVIAVTLTQISGRRVVKEA